MSNIPSKKIILASSSPRRKALLEILGIPFTVVVSDFIEDSTIAQNPHILVKNLSLGKAQAVAQKEPHALIIAADTVVFYNNKILGKPTSKEDAKQILQTLSGTTHFVVTGMTILDSQTQKTFTRTDEATITMKTLSEQEIEAYLATGEPLDKAGAYGIQEKGSIFVKKIEGDFFATVGLSLSGIYEGLKTFGINVFSKNFV